MSPLEPRADAHFPSGPEDVRVMVASEWSERPSEDGDGTVFTLVRPGYEEKPAKRRLSDRTRWLTFPNEKGNIVKAPGVRTHQISLMLGMGKEWFFKALALPELSLETGGDSRLSGGTFKVTAVEP